MVLCTQPIKHKGYVMQHTIKINNRREIKATKAMRLEILDAITTGVHSGSRVYGVSTVDDFSHSDYDYFVDIKEYPALVKAVKSSMKSAKKSDYESGLTSIRYGDINVIMVNANKLSDIKLVTRIMKNMKDTNTMMPMDKKHRVSLFRNIERGVRRSRLNGQA